MRYQVTTTNMGAKFWLRGTVWAFHADRATLHPTPEAAQAALDKARPFMVISVYRRARIEEVPA